MTTPTPNPTDAATSTDPTSNRPTSLARIVTSPAPVAVTLASSPAPDAAPPAFNPMTALATHLRGLGSDAAPVPPTVNDGLLRCPQDDALMEKEVIGGVTIDRCPTCSRLWLDAGELHKLLADQSYVYAADTTPTPTTPTDTTGPKGRPTTIPLGHRTCPRDGEELLEVRHPIRTDVVIEQCLHCHGVLLDAGELSQISGQYLPASAPTNHNPWLDKLRSLLRW